MQIQASNLLSSKHFIRASNNDNPTFPQLSSYEFSFLITYRDCHPFYSITLIHCFTETNSISINFNYSIFSH